MKVIDMHCDTLGGLLSRREAGNPASLRRNEFHVDLERMKESHYLVQNFAMFVPLRPEEDPWERMLAMYRIYQEEMERNRDMIAPVLAFSDIAGNEAAGKLSALLTVEEGAVCKGQVEKLRELHQMGVRMITLTWNFVNEIGHPNFNEGLKEKMKAAMETWKSLEEGKVQQEQLHQVQQGQPHMEQQGQPHMAQQGQPHMAQQEQPRQEEWETARLAAQAAYDAYMHTPNLTGGLTEKGKELVAEMENLGIIPDVSHLSDAGFYNVLAVTKKPFVASHSDARAVCPNVRNMTDDMIAKLSERGGVMGLNFCADFLEEKPLGEENPGTIAAVVRHAKHIVNVGGIDVLGLGSDYDGIPTHRELPGAQSMGRLWDAFHDAGFSEGELDKIFYGNVLRVYKDTLM
nr:membrane dipeptidase [uncultured Acetatifactor sp.]